VSAEGNRSVPKAPGTRAGPQDDFAWRFDFLEKIRVLGKTRRVFDDYFIARIFGISFQYQTKFLKFDKKAGSYA
jgi:hypothetical protein